jgi:hypothetical protein
LTPFLLICLLTAKLLQEFVLSSLLDNLLDEVADLVCVEAILFLIQVAILTVVNKCTVENS